MGEEASKCKVPGMGPPGDTERQRRPEGLQGVCDGRRGGQSGQKGQVP